MKPKPFSTRLRSLRTKAGLSVSQLALAAKMTRQAVGLLESGQRQPSLATAAKLARALGVDLNAFA